MEEQELMDRREREENRYDEEEINLLDIAILLLKRKWMIFFIVFITGVGAVFYSLNATEMYRSRAVIVPVEQERASLGGQLAGMGGLGGMVASQIGIGGTGSLEKFQVVLKSRELTNSLIEKHNLLPIIYADNWDPEKKQWLVDEPPTMQDGYEALMEMLEINADQRSNVLTLGFVSPDPVRAKTVLGWYVEGMSEFLRRQALENVTVQRETLEMQLGATADPLLRAKLADIVAQYVEKEVLTSVQKYYGFNVMDSPFVPEKRFSPKRAKICIMSVMVAFFVAIVLAWFLEYVGRVRKDDPGRFEELKRYMKPW